jgi:dTDP-4-amino-4,6-dideoxygalactose transaminase
MIPRFDVQYGCKDLWLGMAGPRAVPLKTASAGFLPGFPEQSQLAFPTRRGREALYLILKCLGLTPGAHVGVPLYACSVVAKTVVAAGMKPVFLDADPETCGVSLTDLERKAKRLDCLILIHLFGYPADFDQVVRVMEGKPVIEDCAHAIGSTYHGRPLGSLGDISFFSFGFFKPLAIGGGGLIVTRGLELASKLELELRATPGETTSQVLAHSARSFLYASLFSRPIYSLKTYLRKGSKQQNGDGSKGTAAHGIISSQRRMSRSDWNVLASRLRAWRPSEQVAAFWQQVRDAAPSDWSIPQEPVFGEWNHFLLPVRTATPASCTAAISRLRSRGVGAARVYQNCVLETAGAGYSGGCPEAERVAQTLFTLPSYHTLSPDDGTLILSSIASFASGAVS